MTISNEAVQAAARVEQISGVVEAIEDIILDKAGFNVLRSGIDGSFTSAGSKVARLIAATLEAAAAIIRAAALERMADAVLTNDPLDYWSQHLPEGLGFQEAMSSWLKAHAKADRGGQ